MTNGIDVNCLWGTWPFRKLYKNKLSDLQQIHKETGISDGYVSCMNSIFYQDPFEGEEDLHEVLKGTSYKHILTVNPILPAYKTDIERGIKEFGIKGVRVFPTYHHYALNDKHFLDLCAFLKKCRLPLFLTTHVEDERFDYLLLQSQIDVCEFKTFLNTVTDLPVMLMSLRAGTMYGLTQEIRDLPNVYADTSCIKDPVASFEELTAKLGDRKLVYGSQYPLNVLRSTLYEVTMAKIPEASKDRILRDNAVDFFNYKF